VDVKREQGWLDVQAKKKDKDGKKRVTEYGEKFSKISQKHVGMWKNRIPAYRKRIDGIMAVCQRKKRGRP